MIDEKKLIEEIKKRRDYWESKAAEYDEAGERYEYLMDVCDGKATELTATLSIINEQPKVAEWIPSSERLPEEKESVLVQWEKYDRYLNITTTYLDVMWLDDAEEKVFETINGVPNGKVVAWQPLPEPWEGENE